MLSACDGCGERVAGGHVRARGGEPGMGNKTHREERSGSLLASHFDDEESEEEVLYSGSPEAGTPPSSGSAGEGGGGVATAEGQQLWGESSE